MCLHKLIIYYNTCSFVLIIMMAIVVFKSFISIVILKFIYVFCYCYYKNSYSLYFLLPSSPLCKVCVVQHLFTRVLPMPRPSDLHTQEQDDLWTAPITYGSQLGMLTISIVAIFSCFIFI